MEQGLGIEGSARRATRASAASTWRRRITAVVARQRIEPPRGNRQRQGPPGSVLKTGAPRSDVVNHRSIVDGLAKEGMMVGNRSRTIGA